MVDLGYFSMTEDQTKAYTQGQGSGGTGKNLVSTMKTQMDALLATAREKMLEL